MKFRSPYIKKIQRNLWDVLLWKFGYYNEKNPPESPPEHFTYPKKTTSIDPMLPTVQWLGHCTFLLSFQGIHILTDPIWADRCSPVRFLGPKRLHPPPLSLEELPHIDYVLISHNHYDHLDAFTVKELNKRFPSITWIVPKGLKKWFEKRKITSVQELFWWEEFTSDHFTVTAVPAQHYSSRGFFDRNKSLWCGYVITTKEKKAYFAGDTGYNAFDFKTLGTHFGAFDLSLIPIGAYLPHGFMSSVHIDPKEAVLIHQEVNSKQSIGMHWNTFHLSDEPIDQPPYDLFQEMEKAHLNPLHFLALNFGDKINW